MIEDGNFWMAESPLKNAKNAQRILKIVKQLKIKAGRTGPFLISLCEIKNVPKRRYMDFTRVK